MRHATHFSAQVRRAARRKRDGNGPRNQPQDDAATAGMIARIRNFAKPAARASAYLHTREVPGLIPGTPIDTRRADDVARPAAFE